MKPRCDKIRERAFREGLDSSAGAEWRAHCRSCPDCRTELFILENLERQVTEDRQHLGRDEVQQLLATARDQKQKRRPNLVLIWGMRAACLAALLIVGVGLLPGERAAHLRRRVESWLKGERAPVVASADVAPYTLTSPSAAPSGPVSPSVLAPAAQVGDDLRKLRDRLDRRRQSLQQLLERDFGPFNPEDGSYAASQPASDPL